MSIIEAISGRRAQSLSNIWGKAAQSAELPGRRGSSGERGGVTSSARWGRGTGLGGSGGTQAIPATGSGWARRMLQPRRNAKADFVYNAAAIFCCSS